MRGTANEDAMLSALRNKPFIVGLFECGMLAMKSVRWIACSPDGIALIRVDGELVIACVECKSSIGLAARDRILGHATVELLRCTVGDDTFIRLIPVEHVGQVLMQMVCVSSQYLLYVAASESGIAYIVLVYCEHDVLKQCERVMKEKCACFSWIHDATVVYPSFVKSDTRRLIKSRLPLWKLINEHVYEKGPLPPLKLFKHSVQSFYSKLKCGVDGSAQARAVLRSQTSCLAWEQKIVCQTFKTLVVNAFIGYRMSMRREIVQSAESFGNLEKYRDRLNKVRAGHNSISMTTCS